MTQKQFFSAVSAQTGIPQVKVSAVILAALDVITDTLEAGDSIMLRDFGKFYRHRTPARPGRNPRTGETVIIAEQYVPKFTPSARLKKQIR